MSTRQLVNSDNLAPIIVVAFNRPELFKATLGSLKVNPLATESDLYIYIDGVRENHSEDKEKVDDVIAANRDEMLRLGKDIVVRITTIDNEVKAQCKILEQLNPEKVLERGYALMKGEVGVGNVVEITTHKQDIKAKITEVKER